MFDSLHATNGLAENLHAGGLVFGGRSTLRIAFAASPREGPSAFGAGAR
jgi:hypothetical protein